MAARLGRMAYAIMLIVENVPGRRYNVAAIIIIDVVKLVAVGQIVFIRKSKAEPKRTP